MWGILKRLLGAPPARQGDGVSSALALRPGNSSRKACTPPTIDIASLGYVPLPRAPLQWEVDRNGRDTTAEAIAEFEVRDAAWKVLSTDKIPMTDRPDPAFRQLYPTDSGVFMLDDLGNAKGLGTIESAALRYDRQGKVQAKKGFSHDVYRTGVHPLGKGFVVMSKECILFAYDESLDSIFVRDLRDFPNISELQSKFLLPNDQVKNHIRCVALSKTEDRYLFTVVDEAFCFGKAGNLLWSVKFPLKDGWTKIAAPSGSFSTSAEVTKALSLMGLSLPVTPDQVKSRYRELAKKFHPDLNPNDPQAGAKMRNLSAAAEALTGIEASALPSYTGASFVKNMSQTEVNIGGMKLTLSIQMGGGELFASDWIYAAAFAANSDVAYLAGYSGRVVVIDERGKGIRVYDIGAVPRKIIDTGDYLYLLTDTRLYVLRGDELHALVDTFAGGDLVMAQTGFGLLESKRLRWFGEEGQYLGSVVSKDPIRRVYHSDKGMVVETRQRRAIIQGVPGWW